MGTLQDHQVLDIDERARDKEGLRPVHGQGGKHLGRQSGRGGRAGIHGLDRARRWTPPTGSILINNGAASTSTTAVTLNLLATDTGGSGLASMRFRNSTTEPTAPGSPT